jgi:hypothetical protein
MRDGFVEHKSAGGDVGDNGLHIEACDIATRWRSCVPNPLGRRYGKRGTDTHNTRLIIEEMKPNSK